MTPEQEAAYDLEVTELGERVSWWLTNYQFAQVYTYAHDRIWATLMCFTGCIRASGIVVPPEWLPRLDARDMWAPPWIR